MIRDFAQKVDKLYVIEELDDIFETAGEKNLGIACEGKNLFTKLGEYSPQMIAEKILGEKRITALLRNRFRYVLRLCALDALTAVYTMFCQN